MRPIQIPPPILQWWTNSLSPEALAQTAAAAYAGLGSEAPQVSVVIPAYNEADSILKTLASLAHSRTQYRMEIVVVNNNSTDDTLALAEAAGVRCITERRQGITHARNAGLLAARGQYILNADADTLYPPDWVELMVKPLASDHRVALTYGQFSFLPLGNTGRQVYWAYEHLADAMRFINTLLRDEAVNVYGFNSGFRREQGMAVDKFNHPEGTNEDGWLALKLRQKGFGRLHKVKAGRAIVWTTDRRLQIDGGLVKASVRRFKRIFLGGPR